MTKTLNLAPERLTTFPNDRQTLVKLPLALGYTGFAGGIIAAELAPMTGFELSIFMRTPTGYWVGIALAMAAALVGSFLSRTPWLRFSALALAGAVMLSLFALPIIRDYYFVGPADAMSHLGWAKDMIAGRMDPTNLLYPATHLIAIWIAVVTGIALRVALQLVVVVFALVYLVFVPLCVWRLFPSRWAVVIGTFAAALVLPINNISVFSVFYPTSEAIFFTPFVLYLLIDYVGEPADPSITSHSILLACASMAIVLIHPQQALNVLLVFGSVSALQFLVQRYWPANPIATHRPLYAQTLFLGSLFIIWTFSKERFQRAATSVVEGVFEKLLGDGVIGNEVATRGTSLADLGSGIEILFLKLFLPTVVFSVLAGLFLLGTLGGRFDDQLPDHNAIGTYLLAAFIPLTVVFIGYVASSVTVLYFRQMGFIMILVTITGAAAICRGLQLSSSSWRVVIGVSLIFVLLVPLSVSTVFGSPYIQKPSPGVTETRFSGYETALDHAAPGTPFTGIQNGITREIHAIEGTNPFNGDRYPGDEAVVPPDVFNTGFAGYYDEDRYLIVSDYDYAREVALYEGLRYRRGGFDRLNEAPGISLVQSNGDVRVFVVGANGTGTTNRTNSTNSSLEDIVPGDQEGLGVDR